jgi:energy-coupling factor transporter ATP-binding protein EcfA2
MGVAHCRDRTPGHLSGGEQQRVAIAVALANSPAVLLADEPTGELDAESARHVISGLREANIEYGVTTLIVTHDEEVAGQVRRTVAIRDGRIARETHRPGIEPGAEALPDEGNGSPRSSNADVEYAVIDRAGRLQLPPEFTEPLGIKNLVRLTREPGHIEVWPEHGRAAEPEEPDEPDAKPEQDEA